MAIGVILDFEGATVGQYDQVIERMGLEPRGESAPNYSGPQLPADSHGGGLIITRR